MRDRAEHEGGDELITLSRRDLDALVERAAEIGSKKALAAVGLHDDEAPGDIRDLRSLIDGWRALKHTALKTLVGLVVKGFVVLFLIGLVFWVRGEWPLHK